MIKKKYLVIIDWAMSEASGEKIVGQTNSLTEAADILAKEALIEKQYWKDLHYTIFEDSSTRFDIGILEDYRHYHSKIYIKTVFFKEDL